MNIIMLIGNVGKDPEVRSTQGGSKVANFSIATTERWRGKDGDKQERTTWHDCVVWGSLSKVVEDWVSKGSKVAVVGRIEKRKWEDKDGNDRWSVEINVGSLELLGEPSGKRKSRDAEDEDEEEDEAPRKKRKASPPKRRSQPTDDLDDDLADEIPF